MWIVSLVMGPNPKSIAGFLDSMARIKWLWVAGVAAGGGVLRALYGASDGDGGENKLSDYIDTP